jgi:hypothetical protein
MARGDLQKDTLLEDKWSPTASFRSLKMSLAHAVHLKCRVKQLDFIGAFLQLSTHSRIFVGMTLSRKYWYLDLLDFLIILELKPSICIPCLFILIGKKRKI